MPDQAPQTTQGKDELRKLLDPAKRRAVTLFKNDHDDGDTAIYQFISEIVPIIQAELSTQREQARQEVLDELEAELPKYNGWKLHDSHKKWSKATFWEGAIVEVKGLINAKRKEDKK